jgi:hypothetical protein
VASPIPDELPGDPGVVGKRILLKHGVACLSEVRCLALTCHNDYLLLQGGQGVVADLEFGHYVFRYTSLMRN